MRFSLATLFIVFAAIAVGCTAIIYANHLWQQVLVTVVMLTLSFMTLIAALARAQRRAFAVGFVTLGWAYFVLVFFSATAVRPMLLTDRTVHLLYSAMHQTATRAVTETMWSPSGPVTQTRYIQIAQPTYDPYLMPVYASPVPPQVPPPIGASYQPTTTPGPQALLVPQPLPPAPFVPAKPPPSLWMFGNIVHCLWTLVLACVGGIAGSSITAMSARAETTSREVANAAPNHSLGSGSSETLNEHAPEEA